MKRYTIILALLLAIFLVGCGDEQPEEIAAPTEQPTETIEAAIVVKNIEPQPIVYLEKVGDYSLYPLALDELMEKLDELDIDVTGEPRGIYYDDPETVPLDELHWEVAVPVDKEPLLPPGLLYKELPGGEAATMIFKGEFTEDSFPDYMALFSWPFKQGRGIAGPLVEVYYMDPAGAPEENITELYLLLGPGFGEVEVAEEAADKTAEEVPSSEG